MEDARNRAAALWELSDVKPIYRHPRKTIFSAYSCGFGPVIVKMDKDREQLRSEYNILTHLDGKSCCKVYGFDERSGLLLEERILPGTVLRQETSPEARVTAFSRVFRAVHVPGECRSSYLDWLEGIHRYCRENPVPAELKEKAVRAYDICREIFAKYPDRVVLHGDLHHDNLLQRSDGSYAMIDPKGVLGPGILDLPRFMLNEIHTDHVETDICHLEKVIGLLGGEFGFPRTDLRKLFFMEAVLANVWRLEDGEKPDCRQLTLADYMIAECQ